jgi:hypothetical protein
VIVSPSLNSLSGTVTETPPGPATLPGPRLPVTSLSPTETLPSMSALVNVLLVKSWIPSEEFEWLVLTTAPALPLFIVASTVTVIFVTSLSAVGELGLTLTVPSVSAADPRPVKPITDVTIIAANKMARTFCLFRIIV